jgi:serine protease Do
MKSQWKLLTLILAMALILAGCGAPAAAQPVQQAAPTATAAPVTAPVVNPVTSSGATLEAALVALYAQVSPSVVRIRVVEPATTSTTLGRRSGGTVPMQQGLGSGWVLDKQGDIVTNNHVIDGATSIYVTFADGTTVAGSVVGADPDSDLAVVKVQMPADSLIPVAIGDSTQVKAGQLVIAIGNPFGEQNTMTYGIVSAVGRTLPASNGGSSASSTGTSYTIPDVIQTDAPINPGNSGGVLMNLSAQLIGVTAAIESSTNSSAGIGFAIPSAIVKRVVPILVQGKTVQHSYLGISGMDMEPELAQAMNLPFGQLGALVATVTAGGPAASAGLLASTVNATIDGQPTPIGGDVIIAIDGQTVKAFDDVVAYLANSTVPGQTVTLTVLRNGQKTDVKVALTARPTAQGAIQPSMFSQATVQ